MMSSCSLAKHMPRVQLVQITGLDLPYTKKRHCHFGRSNDSGHGLAMRLSICKKGDCNAEETYKACRLSSPVVQLLKHWTVRIPIHIQQAYCQLLDKCLHRS